MHLSRRLDTLPPYIVSETAARVAALRGEGVDVINLSVGSPDFPPDRRIVEEAKRVLEEESSHGYVIGRGHPLFREAAARYMERRFGISVDPDTQVVALLGSKEGLSHLPIALCDPGDVGIFPDPGYLVYRPSLLLAGVVPVTLPLDRESEWRPRWDELSEAISGLERSGGTGGKPAVRLVILNYPHNPTSAAASIDDFDDAVRRAGEMGAVLVNDNAYADIGFDSYSPPSLLQAPGAGGGGAGSGVVEFHSMSKTFSMAGWRCAFAVGDPEVVSALARVKSFYDTGHLEAVQRAAAVALDLADEIAPQVSARYQSRRDLLGPALEALGLTAVTPKATIYLWARLPEGETDDVEYCKRVLDEAGVAVSPGSAYGSMGTGFVRFSLTAPEERLVEAVSRLKAYGGSG